MFRLNGLAWRVSVPGVLPVAVVTVNHVADGVPTVHVKVPPPPLVILIDCD